MADSDQLPYRPLETNLFSLHGIIIGTVLGTLVGGIVLMFLNYRALGRASLANTIAVWGGVVCAGVVFLTAFVPNTLLSAVLFTVLQTAIAYFLAVRLQGPAIAWHQSQAGPMHSGFRAAGIGVLSSLAYLMILTTLAVFWALITGAPLTPVEEPFTP